MDEDEFVQSLNHDFLNKACIKSSATDQNFASIIIKEKKYSKKNSQAEISSTSDYNYSIHAEINTDNENMSNFLDSNNRGITISSDPSHPFLEKYKQNLFLNVKSVDDQPKILLSSLTIPTNKKKHISLKKSNHMSIGECKINQNNFKKININGESIKVGQGFPTKQPIIINTNSQIVQNSDKSFDKLENLIQKLKNNNGTLNSSFFYNDEESKSVMKNDFKYENQENIKKCLLKVDEDFDTAYNKFIEMETNILNDFTSIKTSINKILEDRKEIQNQHRKWLQNMKQNMLKIKHT